MFYTNGSQSEVRGAAAAEAAAAVAVVAAPLGNILEIQIIEPRLDLLNQKF